MKIVTLDQRSQEWFDWRNGRDLLDGKPRITATAASVIMGKNPFKTPYRLWMQLTGRAEPDAENWAMRRGTRMEPEALACYTKETGNVMQPVCIEHPDFPWAAASLDGLSVFGDLLLEIKCPGQSTHDLALSGIVPDYYYHQIQWQLFCCNGEVSEAHYYTFNGTSGAKVVVRPDPILQNEIFEACKAFRQMLVDDTPPAGSDWLDTARSWRNAKEEADQAKENLDAIQKRLIALLPETEDKMDGGGVLVTRYTAKGGVDNDKVIDTLWGTLNFLKGKYEEVCGQAGIAMDGSESFPPLANIIDAHRKPDGTRYRVSATADAPLDQAIKPVSSPEVGEGALW